MKSTVIYERRFLTLFSFSRYLLHAGKEAYRLRGHLPIVNPLNSVGVSRRAVPYGYMAKFEKGCIDFNTSIENIQAYNIDMTKKETLFLIYYHETVHLIY